MAKLSLEQIKQKVFNNSLKTCIYISGYENVNSIIKVKCLIHNYEFETKYENVRRSNRQHHICPYCIEQDRNKKYENSRQEVTCAYCGEKFFKPISKLEKSKSGLYFCCREHKDLAQRVQSGEKFDIIRPDHYAKITDQILDYRKSAFNNYEHKCYICGWDEDQSILEVHHINENHSDNKISNLMILCPICHRKLTSHKYKLINNNTQLQKNN